MSKLCWWCRYFEYEDGDRGYSEYTPGYDPTLTCKKKKWVFDFFASNQDELRQCLSYAEKCDSYEKLARPRRPSGGGRGWL